MGWTTVKNFVTGAVLTESDLDTYVSDNTNFLKGRVFASIPAAGWHADPSGSPPVGPKSDTGPTNLRSSIWTFEDAVTQDLFYSMAVPPELAGGANVTWHTYWRTSASSANMRLNVGFAAIAHDEPYNSASFTDEFTTVAIAGTANDLSRLLITITTPSISLLDWIVWRIQRAGNAGADTVNADMDFLGAAAEIG